MVTTLGGPNPNPHEPTIGSFGFGLDLGLNFETRVRISARFGYQNVNQVSDYEHMHMKHTVAIYKVGILVF